jgi:CBS domain-containing protein
MTQSSTVSDYMTTNLVTFAPDMDIHQAIKTLLQHRISGAPVLDDQGKLVGMLTKKDCLKTAFSASYHKEWSGRVSEYMTADVETVDAGTDLVEAIERFLKSDFQRFPVTRGDGGLVGIVSRHDVLRALADLW